MTNTMQSSSIIKSLVRVPVGVGVVASIVSWISPDTMKWIRGTAIPWLGESNHLYWATLVVLYIVLVFGDLLFCLWREVRELRRRPSQQRVDALEAELSGRPTTDQLQAARDQTKVLQSKVDGTAPGLVDI